MLLEAVGPLHVTAVTGLYVIMFFSIAAVTRNGPTAFPMSFTCEN